MSDFVSMYWPVLLAAGIAVAAAYQVLRHGGVRGMMFGARVLGQESEVETRPRNGVKLKVRVFMVEGELKGRKQVGVELVTKSVLSRQYTHLVLTKREAEELIRALEYATRKAT